MTTPKEPDLLPCPHDNYQIRLTLGYAWCSVCGALWNGDQWTNPAKRTPQPTQDHPCLECSTIGKIACPEHGYEPPTKDAIKAASAEIHYEYSDEWWENVAKKQPKFEQFYLPAKKRRQEIEQILHKHLNPKTR